MSDAMYRSQVFRIPYSINLCLRLKRHRVQVENAADAIVLHSVHHKSISPYRLDFDKLSWVMEKRLLPVSDKCVFPISAGRTYWLQNRLDEPRKKKNNDLATRHPKSGARGECTERVRRGVQPKFFDTGPAI